MTLLVVGALLVPLAVMTAWARASLLDTDRYVALVAPLAQEPAIQAAASARVTEAVMVRIDVPGLTDRAVDALVGQGVPGRAAEPLRLLRGPLEDAVEAHVESTVARLVESEAFATTWTEANRTAHRGLIAAASGDPDAVAMIDEEGVSVRLGPIVDLATDRLAERGFDRLSQIPAPETTIPVVRNTSLVAVVDGYRWLDRLGVWLPWASVVVLAAGVALAPRRSRALTRAGILLLGTLSLAVLAWTAVRSGYLSGFLSSEVEEVLFDQLLSGLRPMLRWAALLALALVLVGYLSGGSASAARLRSRPAAEIGRLRERGQRATGPVGSFVAAHRRGLALGLGAAAALALLLPATVSIGYAVLVLTLAVTLALVLWWLTPPPLEQR